MPCMAGAWHMHRGSKLVLKDQWCCPDPAPPWERGPCHPLGRLGGGLLGALAVR